MLTEQTLFGEVDKVKAAIELLQKHEPPEGYYLCFSGGKDSVVIYDLAIKSGVKFDAHHNITTVEPPQLMKFIRDYYPNVINERPPMTMHALIVKKKIPPLRQMRYCCNYLKERGGQGRFKVTGIRSEESSRRAKRPQLDFSHDGKSSFLHVIKDWSSADVWQYIRVNNLHYCSLYDEGFERIGCVLCPFENAQKTKRDLERFPAIVDYYRRACRKSFEVNKMLLHQKKQVWTSGDDMFNWWINEHALDTSLRIVIQFRFSAKMTAPLFKEDE